MCRSFRPIVRHEDVDSSDSTVVDFIAVDSLVVDTLATPDQREEKKERRVRKVRDTSQRDLKRQLRRERSDERLRLQLRAEQVREHRRLVAREERVAKRFESRREKGRSTYTDSMILAGASL